MRSNRQAKASTREQVQLARFTVLAVLVALACIFSAAADAPNAAAAFSPIVDFQFNEAAGTVMVDDPGDGVDAAVADSVGGYAWGPHDGNDIQLQEVVTDGAGRLDTSGLVSTSRRDGTIPLNPGDIVNDVQNQLARMTVVLAPWSFNTAETGQEIRFGFGNTSATNVFARVEIQRDAADEINVEGQALGTGGATGTTVDLFDDVQNDPITFMLEVNDLNDTFSVFYQVGAGPMLGVPGNTGLALSPDRDGNFLRLAFDDVGGDNWAVDSYTVETMTIPEPSTLGLASLLGLLATARRRRN